MGLKLAFFIRLHFLVIQNMDKWKNVFFSQKSILTIILLKQTKRTLLFQDIFRRAHAFPLDNLFNYSKICIEKKINMKTQFQTHSYATYILTNSS